MTNEKTQSQDTNSTPKNVSDGSELIPAEVQANIRHDDDPLTSNVAIPGTTVDDEGLINNFATEPKVYPATYPSPKQQRRYLFLGVGAIIFVALLVWVSFSVS
jgi:hypothetical protein